MDAQDFNTAHKLIMSKVMPECIQSSSYTLLLKLIRHFNPHDTQDWEKGGAFIVEYAKIEGISTLLEKAKTVSSWDADSKERLGALSLLEKEWRPLVTKLIERLPDLSQWRPKDQPLAFDVTLDMIKHRLLSCAFSMEQVLGLSFNVKIGLTRLDP